MSSYLWIKSLHIVAVISWMAGLLYLPRLFVYHSGQKEGSESYELLSIMEYRLLRYIMNPAMLIVWLTGLHLAVSGGLWRDHWMWLKFACVLGMTLVHAMLSRYRRDFENGRNLHSHKYFRILNEIPTVLMIFIVCLVVVRPF